MRHRHRLLIAITLAWLSFGRAATADAIRDLQISLGVPQTDRGAYESFAKTARMARGDVSDAHLIDLAATVVQGIEPKRITLAIGSRLRVSSHGIPPDAEFGTFVARDQIISRMAQLAVARKDDAPETARTLARGAFVLAAQDRFFGSRVWRDATVDGKFDGMLAPKELDAIKRIHVEFGRAASAYAPSVLKHAPLLDEMIQAEKIDPEKAAEFCNLVAAAWTGTDISLGVRLKLAGRLWRFRCLATARNDEAAVKLVEATVVQLRSRASDPVVLKWLDQVVTEQGPSPRSSGVQIIRSPNDVKPAPK